MNSKDDLTQSTGLETESLNAGDTVTINGEEMKVLSVDDTGNPNLQKMTEDAITAQHDKPELVDFKNMNARTRMSIVEPKALEMWNNLVIGLIRKAKGLKDDEIVELPEGGRGHYVRYALDAHGRLSTGKQHRRRKVRLKSYQATEQRLTQQLFGVYLSSLFRKAQAIAKAASTEEAPVEMKPITQEDVTKAQKWASVKAEQLTNAPKKRAAKLERKRQKTSRRINAGNIPGNSDRRSHASA
jgi:hypothetical protein